MRALSSSLLVLLLSLQDRDTREALELVGRWKVADSAERVQLAERLVAYGDASIPALQEVEKGEDKILAFEARDLLYRIRVAHWRRESREYSGRDREESAELERRREAKKGRLVLNTFVGALVVGLVLYVVHYILHRRTAAGRKLRGIRAAASGDLSQTLDELNQSIATDPKDAVAFLLRGQVRLAKGILSGAFTDFCETIRLHPESAPAHLWRARTRIAKNDVSGARVDLDQALSLDPQLKEAYSDRAALRETKGDLEGSIADLTAAITLGSVDDEDYVRRGMNYLSAGRMDPAMEDFNAAIEIHPDSIDARLGRARVWIERAAYNEASTEIQEALTRCAPGDPQRATLERLRSEIPRAGEAPEGGRNTT